jgi:hypothetical protein
MGKRIICILAALALIAPVGNAAAGAKSPNLAKCNGKQRRPANPYGSILPTVDPVSGTSTPAGQTQGQERDRTGVEVFPGKNPAAPKPPRPDSRSDQQVPPISSLTPSTSNQSY